MKTSKVILIIFIIIAFATISIIISSSILYLNTKVLLYKNRNDFLDFDNTIGLFKKNDIIITLKFPELIQTDYIFFKKSEFIISIYFSPDSNIIKISNISIDILDNKSNKIADFKKIILTTKPKFLIQSGRRIYNESGYKKFNLYDILNKELIDIIQMVFYFSKDKNIPKTINLKLELRGIINNKNFKIEQSLELKGSGWSSLYNSP